MQDMIPFIIVGVFLGAVVYSTIKTRREFTDEQTSMDKLYEQDTIPRISDIKDELEALNSIDEGKKIADIKRCLALVEKTKDVDSPDANQLNQRIASAIRTLKQALIVNDVEQINYSAQYLEILLEERSHIKPNQS